MKKREDEFYIGYADGIGQHTKKTVRQFVMLGLLAIILIASIFAFTQNQFKNSTFELATATKIMGVYHENPYPMLKVKTGKNTFKNILLLGFGKFSANPYLKKIRNKSGSISGSMISIEGNLIYYNGKTLLQITNDEKVTLLEKGQAHQAPISSTIAKNMELKGEIVDPKCYFGVMKPGKGKIHRSCAALCISGGIPPVLVTSDDNNISEYYQITDQNGKAIHKDILPFIGKPSLLSGQIVQLEDWYQIRIDVNTIQELDLPSRIY